jgi:GntR family transcriptional regulator, carbon starvation induced regulator
MRRIYRTTLTAQLSRVMREDILSGALRPGQRLRVQALAKRYGVSQTPLREAFLRLSGEGLVSFDPRLGVSVVPVSDAEFRDLYETRLKLETEALTRSVQLADPAYLGTLQVRLGEFRTAVARQQDSAGDPAELAANAGEAHRAFSLSLFAGCGSVWYMRFIEQLYDHSERYRAIARIEAHRSDSTLKDHEAIYSAVASGDIAKALALHRSMWHETVSRIERLMHAEPAMFGGAADATTADEEEVPIA